MVKKKESFFTRIFRRNNTVAESRFSVSGASEAATSDAATLESGGNGGRRRVAAAISSIVAAGRPASILRAVRSVTNRKTAEAVGDRPRAAVADEAKSAPATAISARILKNFEKAPKEGGKKELNVITEKLSQQEEASIKISSGINGLSSLLGDIDKQLKEQSKTSTELVTTVKTIPEMIKELPESSRVGLELLNTISQFMDKQAKGVDTLQKKVSDFSTSVSDLGEKIDNNTAVRTKEVKVIRDSLGSVEHSIGRFSNQQNKVNKTHASNIQVIAGALKKSNRLQKDRMEKVLNRLTLMNRLVVAMLVVVLGGVAAAVLLSL